MRCSAPALACALLLAAPARADDQIGMLPLRSSVPGLAEADLQLGRAVAEAGQRGAVGPAELKASLARVPRVSFALAQGRELLRQAEEARFHMDRSLSLAAAERARAKLQLAMARYGAPELLAEAWVAVALGELLKPAAPDRAALAFAEALALDPGLRPDPTQVSPSALRLLERARSRARARPPTVEELGRVAELSGLRVLVWGAVEPSTPAARLTLIIYDRSRREVVSRIEETLATGDEPLRALAHRIAAALAQLSSAAPRRTSAAAARPSSSSPVDTTAVRTTGRPWYRRWWVWALTGVVVGGVVTVLAVELSRREASPPPASTAFDVHLHF